MARIGYTAKLNRQLSMPLPMPTMIDLKTQAFHLGDWLVEPAINRLSNDRHDHKLQPKLIQLLCYMAAHPVEMLSRERLLANVWEREFVNDEVLSRCIAQLRQALGDDVKQPRFIETIPRKGYRLLLEPVTAIGSAQAQRSSRYGWLAGGLLILLLVGIYLGLNRDFGQQSSQDNKGGFADPTRMASHFTSQPGIERAADISADGNQVLYVKPVIGGTNIYIKQQPDAAHRLLITGPGFKDSPIFSPDQTQVAYINNSDDGCSLMLFNIASAQSSVVGSCWSGYPSLLDWSHDGRWLAYSYEAPVGAGLALLDMQTRESKILTYPENPQHTDSGPKFSPDDRYLSFSRGDRITRELFMLELGDTHGARQLSFDQQLVNGHDWIDQQRLIYSSDKQAFQALWLLQLDKLQVSYLGARSARNPVYHADSNRLIYEDWQYQANIWSLDLSANTEPVALIISNRYDNQAVFSPDNKKLAFCSNRTGTDSLWLAQADGMQAHLAYSVPDARVSRPAWSPDGERLMVSVYGEQGSQLHELTSDGEFIRVMEWAGEHVSNAVYHPDGERLLYIRELPETSELWQTSLGSSDQSKRVGTISANRVQIGSEGQVFFSKPANDGIFSVQLDTLQQQLIIPELPANAWGHWAIGGSSIIYITDAAVWKRSITTGEQQILTDFLPNAIGITMALSSDEQTLLVTRTDAAEIDLVQSQLVVE